MKLKLPSGVASAQDLTTLLAEIKDYSRWFAHEAIKKQVDAKHTSESPIMSKPAMELLKDWKASQQISQQSLETLINTLQDYIQTAPSITITLAASPTSGIKTSLVAWCRENIAGNILVAFQFNATLLGGMVVQHASHVYDWSFRRQLLAARQNFPEVLRRV